MKFRSLYSNEIELIRQGLERLILSPLVQAEIRADAKSMLEQKMPENLLWRQHEQRTEPRKYRR
jgi:hypothetical protein